MAAVIINNEELQETYHALIAIQTALRKELVHVSGNKFHIDKLVPEYLVKVYSGKDKTAQKFADSITTHAYEGAVLLLIATFERITITKYKTSSGSYKKVLVDSSAKPIDYFDSRDKFVHENFNYLSEIIYLLEGMISSKLISDLKILKEQRNYIVHGKRNSSPPSVEYPLEYIAKTLDDIVIAIEK